MSNWWAYAIGVDFGTGSGRTLRDYFGRGANDVIKRLKQLREGLHPAHV